MIDDRLGMAVAKDLPPESLARNAHEHRSAVEQNNSQEFAHAGP